MTLGRSWRAEPAFFRPGSADPGRSGREPGHGLESETGPVSVRIRGHGPVMAEGIPCSVSLEVDQPGTVYPSTRPEPANMRSIPPTEAGSSISPSTTRIRPYGMRLAR